MSIYSSRPQSNQIYSPIFDETGAVEPIILTELKAHLTITYTDDDNYLTFLITACRNAVEMFCNISIVEKTCLIMIDAYCELELPYGPVQSFTSAYLKAGSGSLTGQTLNTDFEIDGPVGTFQRFIPRSLGRYTLTYAVGYTTVPPDLKLAILHECAFRYERKGDETNQFAGENVGISQSAKILATPFIRMWI